MSYPPSVPFLRFPTRPFGFAAALQRLAPTGKLACLPPGISPKDGSAGSLEVSNLSGFRPAEPEGNLLHSLSALSIFSSPLPMKMNPRAPLSADELFLLTKDADPFGLFDRPSMAFRLERFLLPAYFFGPGLFRTLRS
jgi:hypothetical protein